MRHFNLLNQATLQAVGLTAPTPEIAVVHTHLTFPNGTGDSRPLDGPVPAGAYPNPQMAPMTPEQVEAALASPEYQTVTRGRWSGACGDWATCANGQPSREAVAAALNS